MLAVTQITTLVLEDPLIQMVNSYEITSYTIASNKKSATVYVHYTYGIQLLGNLEGNAIFIIQMTF